MKIARPIVSAGGGSISSLLGSYPPPKIRTGFVLPLTIATFGSDHVCPSSSNPAVHPALSLRFGQPIFHMNFGSAGSGAVSAQMRRPPPRGGQDKKGAVGGVPGTSG